MPAPSTSHAGVAAPGATQTTSAKSSVPGVGFTVPSTWPNRLRPVMPVGAVLAGRWNPDWTQRTVANGPESLSSTRTACETVTGSSAATWSSRSPPVQRSWSLSIEKAGSPAASQAGAWSASPAASRRPIP